MIRDLRPDVRKMSWLMVTGLMLLAVPSTASAQYATMDRTSGEKMAGLQLDFVLPDSSDGFILRADLYAQATFGSLGGYLELPITTTFPDGGDSVRAIGNLELGALYNLGFKMMGATFRLGLVLPTASSGRALSDVTKVLTNLAGNIGRLTDLVHAFPESFTLRLGVSPRIDALGFLFARADLGVDISFGTGDNDRDTLTYFRGNVAVGAGAGIFKAAVELVNYGNVGSGSPDSITEKFAHTLGVTLTFTPPIIHPYVAFVTPLDEGPLGKVFVVSVGVKAALPF